MPGSTLSVLSTTLFAEGREGGLHPFARFYGRDELDRALREADAAGIPRSSSVYLRLLSATLSSRDISTALYSPGTDPREFLALYEAFQARTGGRPHVKFLPGPASSSSPPSLSPLRPDPAWSEWENVAFTRSSLQASAAYEKIVTEISGPPPPTPACGRGSLPVLACFGDWLLAPELLLYLEDAGWRVAFIQKSFDLVRSLPGQDLPLPLASMEARLPLYRQVLEERGVRALVGVYGTFSHNRAAQAPCLFSFGLPVLLLDSEVPGCLPPSERIRLENYLALL